MKVNWSLRPGRLSNWAIIRSPGTIFEEIEEVFSKFGEAQDWMNDLKNDEPEANFDLMKIMRDGTLTTEF